MNTLIVKQDGFYSQKLKILFSSLEEAEQHEALEDICSECLGLIKKDEEEETDKYFFQPHKERTPIESWELLKDAMRMSWKDILRIIKERNVK